MKIRFNAKEAQYRAHQEGFDKLLVQSVHNETLIGAENVAKLENALARYIGTDEAIVCNNQFNAFVLLLMVLGLKAGDEVITSPLASGIAVEAILFMGGRPVFVDIDEAGYTIDVAQIEDAITERTKIIIPVSLFGRCPEMETINTLALQHDICVIEDAAQSFGSQYQGSRSCNLSKLATTSFHPDMPLSAYGNGAALFIQDAALRAKARKLLALGREKKAFTHVGIDAALDELQAAVVEYKLSLFDDETDRRRSMHQHYTQRLKEQLITTPQTDSESNFAYYPVCCEDRELLADRLHKAGIETRIPFQNPLHLHKAFTPLDYRKGDFPKAEKVCNMLLLLPLHAYMSKDDQEQVIKEVLKE
ncbi:DegT/DnrJ/EryC1/StrS family aminotransferase [Sulfurimonas sp. HSL3-7]|uniref:DegT/DnrJ/EryC1/StrS family aminotransferase n=1 Tax=Sulfonitrofixus jiaomeiensis TaxID=3131938 RepID=UPI0031F82A5E